MFIQRKKEENIRTPKFLRIKIIKIRINQSNEKELNMLLSIIKINISITF